MQSHQQSRRRVSAIAIAEVVCCAITAVAFCAIAPGPAGATDEASLRAPGPDASLAEIERCASRNLPDAAGVIGFAVEAVDRSGEVTTSRAEVRWRRDDEARSRIVLRVSEPAETAGTALLVIDRDSGEPEFYLRLPELSRVKRVRSRRLRGPVLGTDFSYEDLDRLREPMDRTDLELIGAGEVDGRPVWRLETRPGEDDDSEYARVVTHVDQTLCLPIRIDLFESGDRLRKQLRAETEGLRRVGTARLPGVFEMQDLERGTRTRVRIDRFETGPDLPAEQFTRQALVESPPAAADPSASASPSPASPSPPRRTPAAASEAGEVGAAVVR